MITDEMAEQIGEEIYSAALRARRGFRPDQLGIPDDDVWAEIHEALGHAALEAAAPMIRAAALEEAAAMVETHALTMGDREPFYTLQPARLKMRDHHHATIAKAIRAMAAKETDR